MANSVDPDETAHFELSHLDLFCLQKYDTWSAGLRGSRTGNAILSLKRPHVSVGKQQ